MSELCSQRLFKHIYQCVNINENTAIKRYKINDLNKIQEYGGNFKTELVLNGTAYQVKVGTNQ